MHDASLYCFDHDVFITLHIYSFLKPHHFLKIFLREPIHLIKLSTTPCCFLKEIHTVIKVKRYSK